MLFLIVAAVAFAGKVVLITGAVWFLMRQSKRF
jgi:hypothetical protein